jgi:hypothetical protein
MGIKFWRQGGWGCIGSRWWHLWEGDLSFPFSAGEGGNKDFAPLHVGM